MPLVFPLLHERTFVYDGSTDERGVPVTIIETQRSQLSIDELADAVARGTAEQAAHLAHWLGLVAEFARRDGHLQFGLRSVSEFLSWRCGIDGRTARDHVRVAQRLEALPLVRREMAAGRLSYSKVRALTRTATEANEELLVSLATDLSAAQLERVITQYEALHGPALTETADDERRRQCGVTRWVDNAGLVHYEVIAAPDEAGLIDAALAFGSDSRFAEAKAARAAAKAGGEAEPPPLPKLPHARQQLESMQWVLRRGLVNAARDDLVEESRYLVVLHVREGQAMVTPEGRVDLGNGLTVTPKTLQRLGCGGMVQAMLSSVEGRPLDLGDRVRLATRNQRMALKAQYPTCDIPGCETPFDWCDVHHLVPWEAGGPTDLANLRPRCRRHHHLVHEGGWREVLDDRGRTVLLPPDGRVVMSAAPPLTPGPVGADALVASNRARGVRPPDDLSSLGGHGTSERLSDYGFATIIEALCNTDDLTAARTVDEALAGADPPMPA